MEEFSESNDSSGTGQRQVGYHRSFLDSKPNIRLRNQRANGAKKFGSSALVLLFTISGLSVALFVVPGTIGHARASAPTYWGLDGYLGNHTIYLTTNDYYSYLDQYSNDVNFAQSWQNDGSLGFAYNVTNAINISLAENGQYPLNSTNPPPAGFPGMSAYHYNPSTQTVNVNFNIGIAGVSNRTLANTYYTAYQLVQLSISGYPGSSQNPVAQIASDHTMGINTSGSNLQGTSETTKFENLALDLLGFVPGLGFVIGSYATMKDILSLVGAQWYNQYIYSNGAIYDEFTVLYAGTQEVFTSAVNMTVALPISASGMKISIMGENMLPGGTNLQTGSTQTNAVSYINYTTSSNAVAYPSEVYDGGQPAVGQWVKYVDQSNGSVFYEQTDSLGQCTFFGPPDRTYDVYTTFNTPWGPSTGEQPSYGYNKGTTAATTVFKSGKFYGQVTTNEGAKPASLSVKNPAGSSATVYTNSIGDYSFLTPYSNSAETYTLTASASFSTATEICSGSTGPVSDTINAGQSYLQDFYISMSCSPRSACVLYGSYITLADGGTLPVQNLSVGTKILSYNITSHSLFNGTVVKITSRQVSQVWYIDGILGITGLNDQPIYVQLQNGSEEWLLLGKLNQTMKIYDPINNTWLPVYNITVLHGNFTVYDISAAPVYHTSTLGGDYIANGILIDDKRA